MEAAGCFSAAHLDLLELVMKRIVRCFTSALVLAVAAPPALCFNLTSGLYAALSDVVLSSKAHPTPTPVLINADFVMSKFDKSIVETFGAAWRRVGNGSASEESVVLILRMRDGLFSGRDLGRTHEHKQFTFSWHPATIGIVHTHPNSSNPRPQDEDIAVADKYRVPIFTITSRGMYVYDPTTRKTRIVMANLDWLEFSNWNRALFAKH
jgi:hypothetical protein